MLPEAEIPEITYENGRYPIGSVVAVCLLVLVAAAILFVLASPFMDSHNAAETELENANTPQYEPEESGNAQIDDAPEVQIPDDAWYISYPAYASAEDAAAVEYVSSNPFFILHNGFFYHLESTRMLYRTYSNSTEAPVVDALNLRQDELPILKLADGDKLVAFTDETEACSVVEVQELGACIPIKWFGGGITEALTQPKLSNPDFDIGRGVDEICGQTVTRHMATGYNTEKERTREAAASFCALLDELGFGYITIDYAWTNNLGSWDEYTEQVIVGEYGDSITFGQYDETRYIETQACFDSTLYGIDMDSAQKASVERTHDGYFVVDIPDGFEGLAALQFDDDSLSGHCHYFYPFIIS